MKHQWASRHLVTALCLAFCLISGTFPVAFAASAPVASKPSVLIIDAGLGDLSSLEVNWLGSSATTVTTSPTASLLTTKKASWWTGDGAPATFLLTPQSGGAITDAEIVWALDGMAASGAQRKTVFVACGAAGLQARRYIEDLGTVKQSGRADAVGLVLLGTPNNGLSQIKNYPLLKLWTQYAAGAGLTPEDLTPDSPFLTELSAGAFPQVLKTIEIQGEATDLGFGGTDGVCALSDYKLTQSSGAPSDEVQVRVTASSGLSLTGLWQPATNSGGEKLHVLDAHAIERLDAIDSYATSSEVRTAAQDFYQAWFSTGAPVTHVSTVLTLDVSGSMNEKLASGDTKLAAAKTATTDFLKSVAARSGEPLAVPEDVQVLGFNTAVANIAADASSGGQKAVASVKASGNTDVGKAIKASVNALASAPLAGEKRIVFLSDGLSTEGANKNQILTGPVTAAKVAGVRIDTIAFGKVGQADTDFLKQIAAKTNGTFYQPQDTYGLRLSFLSARYSTLGALFVDQDAPPVKNPVIDLGTLKEGTKSVEFGIIADGQSPSYTIECDGAALSSKAVKEIKGADGMLVLQLEDLKPGAYQMRLSGKASRAHVFAVKQMELYQPQVTTVTEKDNSLYLLIGAGVLLILALAFTIIISRSKGREGRKHDKDFITDPLEEVPAAEEVSSELPEIEEN